MIVSRSYRHIFSLLCVCAVSGMLNTAVVAAEKISDKVDVEVSQLRKSRARDQFQVDVTLKNKSDAAIAGPIVLAIKGTGVRGLVLTQPDGHLAAGLAYLEVIDAKGSLKAGTETSLKGISFDASPLLKSDELEQFELQTEVYRTDDQDKTTAANGGNKRSPRTTGSNFPAPQSSGSNGGNTTSGNPGDPVADKPSEPLEPSPDPAFHGDADDPKGNPDSNRGHTTKRPGIPTQEEVAEVIKIQDNWNTRILDIEGAHSIGTGWGKDGGAVISVEVENFAQKKLIPATLDGIPVEVFVSERPKLLQFGVLPDDYDDGNRARGGVFTNIPGCFEDPKEFFPRPTPIGVSGWNAALQLCATGTLGCRLEDESDEVYILSNSHVLADYGNRSAAGQAAFGDPVIQPGPIDLNCAIAPDSTVGSLVAFSGISFSMDNVNDSAIALTSPLFFSSSTPCDGYGMPRELTVPAFPGMEAMKYGRTTKFTVGDVTGINVTADITIDPFTGQTARYVGLIDITSNFAYGPYIAGGDSGSLSVTRNGRFPIGLNFAGNVFSGLAIPIDLVLQLMALQGGIFPDELTVDGEPFPIP